MRSNPHRMLQPPLAASSMDTDYCHPGVREERTKDLVWGALPEYEIAASLRSSQ
jgi:hypothetical protein